MESTPAPRLLQQAEKILLHPIHPHLIAYCPTMDLIALVTDEENLDVYRINGQRAFGLKRKSEEVTVDGICWEFNGQALAVAWSDGYVDILSAETGKVIHKDVAAPESKNGVAASEPRISCMGWGLNFIDVDSVKRKTGHRKRRKSNVGEKSKIDFTLAEATSEQWDDLKEDTSLEDFLQRQPDLQALDIAPDLPDQLAMMDMENLLPKLPSIPAPPPTPFMRMGQKVDSGTFSSQPQVDSLLHSQHMKDNNSVDMFIRCTDQGSVHPSIYDSLETVNITLPNSWKAESSKPLLHTSHPYSCSHALLTEVKKDGRSNLAFVPLTLGFIPSAGIYLHLIASKTSQLQNLLLYVQQSLQRIRTYWKHSQDLPGKFMMNVSETLEEKGQGDLVQNLYHLACTGHCPEVIREWLVDELAEAGHKRWDNTVTSSLATIIQLLHENLLPALDRCSLSISRLRGLAAYHDAGWIFTTPSSSFTSLLTILQNLRLLAHTALHYIADEKREFHAFSKWLRFEIDFEATEPESQSRAEMEGRDAGVDIGLVLEYIEYGLRKSDTAPYLRPEAELTDAQKGMEAATYDDTKKAIELLKEGATYKEEALCLDHVFRHLNTGCTQIFQQISQWQESNTKMNCGVIIESSPSPTDTDSTPLDMRMVYESNTTYAPEPTSAILRRLGNTFGKLTLEPKQQQSTASSTTAPQADHISTYIAVTPSPSSSSRLHIHRLTHTPTIDTLPKALNSYAISTLDFDPATIVDAKFADDTNLLVTLQLPFSTNDECENVLISLPYTSTPLSSSSSSPITYTPIPTTSHNEILLPLGEAVPDTQREVVRFDTGSIREFTKHVFDQRFTPLRLVVNGRRGRRVVVVLGSDRKHYRVLDLDFREKGGRKDGGGGDEGDEGEGEDEDEGSDRDVEMGGA